MKRRDIVLVVDDTPGTLGLLNETLEEAGFTVLLAQSAAAAFTVLERITPDIVLIDAIMPGMDGFEACRRMRSMPALIGTPIVFMTGLTETEHVLHGLAAGGVDYVTKPLAPDEVVARLGVHLANARLTRSAHVALDAAGRFLLATAPDGTILWSTPQAATLLADIDQPALAARIAALQQSDQNPVPGQLVALIQGTPAIECHYVGSTGPDEILLRVTAAADPTREASLLHRRLGLTLREAEVLLWLGRGKPNRDIAEILGLSPRTVNKHLEQIYPKLGVENRAAATALAVRTISE